MDRIESIILRSLLYDEPYTRRVLPFIEEGFFSDHAERTVYKTLRAFVDKYNSLPTKEAVVIELDGTSGISQEEFDAMTEYLSSLETEKDDKPNSEWLVERTESWCQERAIHNAVIEVINILEGKDQKNQKPKGAIPKLLSDALAISFDPHVGHDYLEDADTRFEFYNLKEKRIPFHLDYFNKVTKNGVPAKTLNVILAGTGVGKSLVMCDFAADYLAQGHNVLYITMEMAEERIAERIDANLMDVPLDELQFMKKDGYSKRIERIRQKTKGKLIIKEYPTAAAHVGHFRHLLNELSLKKNFKPQVIFIDYLNICASSRVKGGAGAGLYELVKSIAEELRGLAVEVQVPIWTATQTNRAGFANNDPDLTNTSESFGLPATADFMFALISDDTLQSQNQLLVKILKNRYSDVSQNKKFLIGVDRSKMKLYDLEESAQEGLSDAGRPRQPNGNANRPPREGGAAAKPPKDDAPFDIDRGETFDESEYRRKKPLDNSVLPYKSAWTSARTEKPRKELKV